MPDSKKKIVRISTVPMSLRIFCKDLFKDLKNEYEMVGISSPGQDMEFISELGIDTCQVKMSRKISPLSDLVSLVKLIAVFRRLHPDMVHSITPKAGLLAMMAARITGVPVRVHSFTGLLFPTATGFKKLLLKLTDAITCACATNINAEGQGVKSDIENAHITSKDVRVLGYGNIKGVDMEYFSRTDDVEEKAASLRCNMNIKPSDFVFVYVGRVVRDKGIAQLVEAFERTHLHNPATRLVLVGDEDGGSDPIDSSTRQAIATNSSIIHVNQWLKDVRPFYAMSQALVLPSYREGFPNVVLEAGAMSVPSIVTEVNGAREIIDSGTNGLVVPIRDVDALEQAMIQLTDNQQVCRNMASVARGIIDKKFEASFVRGCIKDYYKEITDDNGFSEVAEARRVI